MEDVVEYIVVGTGKLQRDIAFVIAVEANPASIGIFPFSSIIVGADPSVKPKGFFLLAIESSLCVESL